MRSWLMGGLLVLLGVLVVALLMSFRVDVEAVARTGPRWRRKLIGAGLAVLAALGVVLIVPVDRTTLGGESSSTTSSTVGSLAPPIGDEDLAATREWKSLSKTWTEAAEIAAGKKGRYPFDDKGKKRLLEALVSAVADIEMLRKDGTLSDAEAALLSKESVTLRMEVARMRPTELENATCYLPMGFPPAAQVSAKRLTERLPLLESMAAADRLHPGVAAKVLDTIEADARILADKKQTESLPETGRAEATELSTKATAQVERIRARLAAAQGGGSLEDSPGWKTIMNAWTTAGTLADKGSTTAQRRDADNLLDEARLKAKVLAAAGLLSKGEGDLLCADADRLHERIYANPPTDDAATCYDTTYVPPAKLSLEWLNRRLPLLRQLAADGKLHPAAVRKVLPTIEADLKTLSDAKETGKLESKEQAQAKETRSEVEKALASIKTTLGSGQ